MISEELTIELQKILKTEYGANLSITDVFKIGDNLVEVYDVIAKIDFREKYDKD